MLGYLLLLCTLVYVVMWLFYHPGVEASYYDTFLTNWQLFKKHMTIPCLLVVIAIFLMFHDI